MKKVAIAKTLQDTVQSAGQVVTPTVVDLQGFLDTMLIQVGAHVGANPFESSGAKSPVVFVTELFAKAVLNSMSEADKSLMTIRDTPYKFEDETPGSEYMFRCSPVKSMYTNGTWFVIVQDPVQFTSALGLNMEITHTFVFSPSVDIL